MISSAPASLVVEHLTHRYSAAARPALDDVGFRVEPGQRVGLLGPNGAGKSTLMRIACGFLPLGVGSVRVADLDVRTHSHEVRQRTGYMPELVPLYPELRVREHLAFRAAIKAVARRAVDAEVVRVAEACGLVGMLDVTIGKLSRGYRQRVGIADALLGAPPLVVLDEPTVGLDPNQIREIREMLRALGGGQTLVFSSHILAEVESLCDRVVILASGKVVLDAALSEALGTAHLDVELGCDVERAGAAVATALAGVGLGDARVDATPRDGATAVRIDLPKGDREAVDRLRVAVGEAALAAGVPIVALVPGRTRLEARFAEVTGGQRDGG